jgi:hypothetical protein
MQEYGNSKLNVIDKYFHVLNTNTASGYVDRHAHNLDIITKFVYLGITAPPSIHNNSFEMYTISVVN